MPAVTLITILGFVLLLTGILLSRLPVATCRECPHCQLEQLARQREAEDRVGRYYGFPHCPACGGYHEREQPHRR